ncbi:MAG: hypothetical protein HC819_17855 [Cyclobacteriaceae bacterium]|nr:hypothetical protein [Cyclobacteriaceae bacterium]
MKSSILNLSWKIGLIALLFYHCDGNKQKTLKAPQSDSLMITYGILQDSVQRNWEIMIADDDEKLALLNRLLQEVSHTNNYDKLKFNELKSNIDQLKAMRYDQQTMGESALIDKYDSATIVVSDQVIGFARSHPRYDDFPLMEELVQEINAKNNYILLHRNHYDFWAKELNSYTDENGESIKRIEPDFREESLPLFQLPS